MSPIKKETKEKYIPKGVKPEQVSEEQFLEIKEKEEKMKEQFEQEKETVKEQTEETMTEALDLESKNHLKKQTAQPVDPQLKAIQDILQEDIYELYIKMSPEEQEVFRQEGKRVAVAIKGILNSVKVNVKKIIKLIRNWLRHLPGINKYFIEQESKIKLDKLLDLKELNKERAEQQMTQTEKK